jgi:hypothetical protein
MCDRKDWGGSWQDQDMKEAEEKLLEEMYPEPAD